MHPHQVEWTPERIQRFWDFFSANQSEDAYFSRMFGRSLLAYVRRRIKIGTPLDYGCGCGDLLSYLVDSGSTAVFGIDQSPASRAAAAEKLGAQANAIIAAEVPAGCADTAFMIEVVEHLDDTALDAAFHSIRRALKPGGHFVITTPNAEDIAAKSVFCPECLAIFHPVQHVRSWTAASLSAYAESQGFRMISVEPTILSLYSGVHDWAWRTAKLAFGAKPNLIYIGQKRD